ncbi:CLIP domain-containing serine protease HP8-like [Armigeres subalbatus]|uniref:CLIP domain-containing serine protease HP8-like n=1 Tax=Armigeres subalbatus TaxID=124917 RepID=UPI002ED31A76
MHIFIAITTTLLLLLVEQYVVCANKSSTASVKQCENDQLCVDISLCEKLSKYKGDIIGAAICGSDHETEHRKICCQVPLENKINTPDCGLPTENRILIPTYNLYENPWMALIRDWRKRIFCSGTLIAKSFILTAASCVFASINGSSVRVGEYHLSRKVDCLNDGFECADPPLDVAVVAFIAHPKYDPITRENDIALLKIVPVDFSKSVRPICLSSDWQQRGSLVGWHSSSLPSKTIVSVVGNEKCTQTVEEYNDGTRKMYDKICVRMELSGDCEDSRQFTLPGSSFQVGFHPDGRLVQQGLWLDTSYCVKSERILYGVLTNVTIYMDWIKNTTEYYGFDQKEDGNLLPTPIF